MVIQLTTGALPCPCAEEGTAWGGVRKHLNCKGAWKEPPLSCRQGLMSREHEAPGNVRLAQKEKGGSTLGHFSLEKALHIVIHTSAHTASQQLVCTFPGDSLDGESVTLKGWMSPARKLAHHVSQLLFKQLMSRASGSLQKPCQVKGH